MHAPLACVMGDMDLLRPLGMAGIRCASVAPPGDPIHFSRFTVQRIEIDSRERDDVVVEQLLRFARGQPSAPVLLYQEDRFLLLVSRHRDRLAEAFRFVVADAALVEDLVDKARFDTRARELGLPVPRSRRLAARGAGPADLDLRFPVLLKPLPHRTARWQLVEPAGKAVHVATADGLRALWPRLVSAGIDVLAQEAIPGPEARIESYHVYVDERDEVAAEFTGRKLRTRPPMYGHTTALTLTTASDVTARGRELTRLLGLRGVAKLDFKRDPSGELRLLEVNPRFTLWHHPAAVAGLNVPALVYADLTGRPRPPARGVRPGVGWCNVWRDFEAARVAGTPLRGWSRWAVRCEAKSIVALDDPLPFLRGRVWAALARRARGA